MTRHDPVRRSLPWPLAGALLAGLVLGTAGTLAVDRGTSADPGTGACWGTFADEDARALLGDGEHAGSGAGPAETVSSETDLRTAMYTTKTGVLAQRARCVISEPPTGSGEFTDLTDFADVTDFADDESLRRAVVTAGHLDRHDIHSAWSDTHLRADGTPLAGDLRGMAGPRSAWVILPDDCRASGYAGPVVVDIELSGPGEGPGAQALARGAVRVANTVMREHGCAGRLPESEPLPAQPPEPGDRGERGEFCGLTGDLPEPLPARRPELGPPGGPVRACDGGALREWPEFRLITVSDPMLVDLFSYSPGSGDGVRLAVRCHQRDVLFFGEAHDPAVPVGDLLRRYAEQETQRLGCGPVTPPPAAP